MNKINKAKEYCIKKLETYEGDLDKKFLIQMMLSIEKKILQIQKEKSLYNIEPLLIGTYFHDIGRIISDEDDHTEKSYELFIEFKKENQYTNEELEIIKDCCLNHGSSSNPITKEGKILQILDKAIVFEPEVLLIVLEKMIKKESSWDEGYKLFLKKMNKWHNKIPDKKTREEHQETLNFLNKI